MAYGRKVAEGTNGIQWSSVHVIIIGIVRWVLCNILNMQLQSKSPESLIKYETEIEMSSNAEDYKKMKNAGPVLDARPSP